MGRNNAQGSGKYATTRVIEPRLAYPVAPRADSADEIPDFSCQRQIIVCSRVLGDGLEVISGGPEGDPDCVFLLSRHWRWVRFWCEETCLLQRVEKVRVVVSLQEKPEALPREFVILLHHRDEGLLFRGKRAHARGSISRASSSSTRPC